MQLRTYYWNDRVLPKWKIRLKDLFFREGYKYFSTGNAGDILVKDIVRKYYGAKAKNVQDEGRRLMLVGSVSHRVKAGDVLCGIGTQGKADELPRVEGAVVLGLRGPISYDEFSRKGYDLSQVKFLMDPGLLVRFMYYDEAIKPEPGATAFVPHYKERRIYKKLSESMKIIDIDATPEQVCKKILSVEHVFSSSLHGIIFAHALGRPASLVLPKTESLLKYKDYYSSMGLDFPTPISDIDDIRLANVKPSPVSLSYREEDFVFPEIQLLQKNGVVL